MQLTSNNLLKTGIPTLGTQYERGRSLRSMGGSSKPPRRDQSRP